MGTAIQQTDFTISNLKLFQIQDFKADISKFQI